MDAFPDDRATSPKPSSWSTTDSDHKAGVPFPLWKDPRNPIHTLQWDYLAALLEQESLARSVEHLSPDTARFAKIARGVLDAALHSCQFWWAARRPLGDIQMIYKGLGLMEEAMVNATRAVMHVPDHEPLKTRARGLLMRANNASNLLQERLSQDK